VAATCIGSFVVYALLAQAVGSPRIFIDELVYWDPAASLARGEGLSIRGEPYPYGALYPALLAGIFRVFPDRELAYELAKSLNALLFALTAVPVYLLARRVLRPWSSAAVAALSVAIPSSMYVSVVMTECLAYLTAAWAAYGILVALERPTFLSQGAALVALLLAYSARPQLAVLYAAYLLGLGLTWFLSRRDSDRWRGALFALWPTGVSLAATLAALVLLPVLRGESLNDLGGYQGLWRAYDPGAVVHEYQVELVEAGARSLPQERRSSHPFHDLAIPTLVGSPCLLEKLIGLAQMACIGGRRFARAPARSQ